MDAWVFAPRLRIIIVIVIAWVVEWASSGGRESFAIASHQDAIALRRRFAGVLRLLDLRYQELKGLAHVLVVPRARLGPAALDLLGELLPVLGGDLPLLGSQIALVAHDDDGDRLGALGDEQSAFSLSGALSSQRCEHLHSPGGLESFPE